MIFTAPILSRLHLLQSMVVTYRSASAESVLIAEQLPQIQAAEKLQRENLKMLPARDVINFSELVQSAQSDLARLEFQRTCLTRHDSVINSEVAGLKGKIARETFEILQALPGIRKQPLQRSTPDQSAEALLAACIEMGAALSNEKGKIE